MKNNQVEMVTEYKVAEALKYCRQGILDYHSCKYFKI